MAVNKVVYNTVNGEEVLMDLTSDTVTPATLAEGTTAHDASGEMITGTMPTDNVRYGSQSLTEAQKAQARTNIGAASVDDVADLNVRIGQQHLLFAEGDTVEEALEWLKTNGDTSKVYVLPDGFFYEYKQTVVETGGVAYTNRLPQATDTDRTTIYGGDYNSDGVNDGYITKNRLSSSGSISTTNNADCRASGFIPASVGDVVRFKGTCGILSTSTYVIAYNSSNTKTGYKTFSTESTVVSHPEYSTLRRYSAKVDWYTYNQEEDVITFTLTAANFGTGFNAIRFSGYMDENTIVTVNQEIKEGGGTTIVDTWASTGQAFVPTDYDEVIAELVDITDAHTQAIKTLRKNGATGTPLTDDEKLLLIRNWDKPIYERLTPFLLDADLVMDTTYPKSYTDSQDPDGAYRRKNVQAVYDEYNALCTAHPDFVRDITDVEHGLANATETTFGGLCSDGIQYVRVYEFCEREGRHSNTTNADYWSETKPTFIIVTGIHWEYNGVYSMFHALKLITENPNLRDMRRNCRFIVIPMSNPYCFVNYANAVGHYNANGVEIHNNFTVDFNNEIDATHGTAPLSEVETRYIDNAMRKYADTGVCLLTCHSNATKGSNFIWGSVATKFMCNVSMRLVDLMSYAWDSKYDNYRTAIDTLKVGNSNPQEDGDYRCGFASLSTSTGTETKQALGYGMQGINVEVYEKFYLFDPDGTDIALARSRGAEVYVNLLRLLAVTYDHNDRDKYAPSPLWSE